jgi:toxin FitB
VVRWWAGQDVALTGHALAETYSVLTRLPGDARLAAADVIVRLIVLILGPEVLAAPGSCARVRPPREWRVSSA